MYPPRIAGMSLNAATPISSIRERIRDWSTAGPFPGSIGANAMAAAMRIPPQAMNGMAYDTPFRRYCRSLSKAPFIWRSLLPLTPVNHPCVHHGQICCCNEPGNVGGIRAPAQPPPSHPPYRRGETKQLKFCTIHWTIVTFPVDLSRNHLRAPDTAADVIA